MQSKTKIVMPEKLSIDNTWFHIQLSQLEIWSTQNQKRTTFEDEYKLIIEHRFLYENILFVECTS